MKDPPYKSRDEVETQSYIYLSSGIYNVQDSQYLQFRTE